MSSYENETVEIRPLMWKGQQIPDYEISSDGQLYHNGKEVSSWLVNGRNYSLVWIDGHLWQYRVDYMVAYTFLGMRDDAIRLIHINDDIADDHLSNLMWYRKVDVMKEYINQAIIESDGSIIEEWRPCKLEYNDELKYEVSNFGMIRDTMNNNELIKLFDSHGYRVFYYLDKRNKQTRIKAVHRAVAEAFIPNPNNYELVNHLDGNKSNDAVYNLEWASAGMNMEHAYMTNLNNKVKYTPAQIHTVCDLLSHRNISQVQIGYMTGVDRKTISDIYRGRRWKEISSEYILRPKKWTPEMKQQIENMILQGFKGKEIFAKMNTPYDQAATSLYERMHRELRKAGKI